MKDLREYVCKVCNKKVKWTLVQEELDNILDVYKVPTCSEHGFDIPVKIIIKSKKKLAVANK